MNRYSLFALVLLAPLSSLATTQTVAPFEKPAGNLQTTPIDTMIRTKLQECGIKPANPCSDEVFIRRVYLDVLGTLPEPPEVHGFLGSSDPDKRARVIDTVLGRDEFADYWTMKWCDLLRVKAEFPINLWPNAVQAYYRWVHDSLKNNKPYDQFVRELLTSSGSNFRVPPVNFYRAIQGRDPSAIAGAVALTFMGTRIENWPEAQRAGMAAFFSRVTYKKTGEWKEEIVCLNPELPDAPITGTFPDGVAIQMQPDQDPRQVFASWLVSKDNPWLARSAVNRIWAWLMGRGIIHEPDDIRPENPPVNPELLAFLEKELVGSNYDLRHVYRLILNSATYQQSCIPQSENPQAEALFAYYPVRRLEAEVLIDALDWMGGMGETYSSAIPEPFTFIPENQRTITLADGSTTSAFLEMFGRPARDTGLYSERNNLPSDAQRLYLLNSSNIQGKIEKSRRLRTLLETSKGKPEMAVRRIYLNLISRFPTREELDSVRAYAKASSLPPRQVAMDLVWTLINSKEFLYRH